jgi:TolB-like protein
MSLIAELKRRNVFRVAAAYVVLSWLVLQIVDVVAPILNLPDSFAAGVFLLLAIGFLPALAFSWVYELTPEGLKKESQIDPGRSVTAHTGRKLDYITIGMIVIGVAIVYFQPRFSSGPQQAPDQAVSGQAPDEADAVQPSPAAKSIAVLPFVNMSADPENEYFADGLSEELLNQLAQIPNLMVAGRTSSFSFKGKDQDLRDIGSILGVANVLEGSVRRQGDQVRVTAQLVRVNDGFHLWSNTYDRLMDDVFAIQDDISANVAGAMKIVLDESARERMQAAGVRNVDAFVEFQKGVALFTAAHGPDPLMETLEKGVPHFDRALELVPDFAAAYWQKSDYFAHIILEPNSTDKQRQDALLELREVLDSAYSLSEDEKRKAFVDVDRVLFSEDWTPLRDRIDKALATAGCPDPTWIQMATVLGYARAAGEMWTRYERCEPLNMIGPLERSAAAFWQKDYETALKILTDAEAVHGTNPWFAANRQRVLMAQGRAAEALELASAVEVDRGFYGMGGKALPLASSGDLEGARVAMDAWKEKNGRNLRSELEIHAALGDRQRANELAAEIDARPGGSMLLTISIYSCACGVAFDVESTPNFNARIQESGVPWPPETHVRYPAKDW